MSPAEQKRAVRAQMTDWRRRAVPALRQAASLAVCQRLRSQPQFQKARALLFYAALPDEIDISNLAQEVIQDGKIAAFPRFINEWNSYAACQANGRQALVPGKFGVLEPDASCPLVPLKQLDFILVPGVAFDRSGRRLGRGRGVYDRLLVQANGWRCGVGFDEQLLDQLPHESHDMILNGLVTPTQWLAFGPISRS